LRQGDFSTKAFIGFPTFLFGERIDQMHRKSCSILLKLVLVTSLTFMVAAVAWTGDARIQLPAPSLDGEVAVETAIATWKTSRQYADAPLTMAHVGQLLWAANGKIPTDAVSGATGRVIPSAWKVYPLEIFLVTGEKTVEKLRAGVYRYDPDQHSLETLAKGDKRGGLSDAALGQKWMAKVPVAVIISVDFDKTTGKTTPEQRADWGRLEAGMAGQNMLLQARALGLKTNTPALFKASELAGALSMPEKFRPVLIVTAGK
jgi:SagB-type dehydrogenase family enzyme